MKVLVVGSGGREHALVWKLSKSPRVKSILAAPGNAGIAEIAECAPVAATDINGLLKLAYTEKVDLTVVGPEAPLVAGIVDKFNEAGLRIFGPTRQAAALEGSKIFAKELLHRQGIPTAAFRVFDDFTEAREYVLQCDTGLVVKTDGLAAGKGVIVAKDVAETLEALENIMIYNTFGSAGSRVLVEEKLAGPEVSLLAFTDGETVLPMLAAQDHKPAFDGDTGPNTGGMGAYAPAPVLTPDLYQQVLQDVLIPIVSGLKKQGIIYRGVLYAGMMLTAAGPQVLEFNVRFGDPEAQPLLVLLENDLVEVFEATVDGNLHKQSLSWHSDTAVCVVLTADGYPGPYEKGQLITGLGAAQQEGAHVFHAGTVRQNGELVTAGGRVLGVTATAPDIKEAIDVAYLAVDKILFKGAHYRKDIGQKALI